jgi:uncharacterized surface protein with fasciclin (FAS1) repeats
MSYQEGLNSDPAIASTRDERAATADLLDTLQSLGSCSKFVDCAKAAGFGGLLRGPNYITIFAPEDSAFSRVLGSEDPAGSEDRERLADLIGRHLIRGNVKEVDLRAHSSVKSIAGETLNLERDGATVKVAGARIRRADIPCTNGMIHLIEGTLV